MKIAGEVYEPFSPDSYTVTFDLYLTGVLEDAGVAQLLAESKGLEQHTEKDKEDMAREFLRRVTTSGHVGDILSCCVQPPPPAKWNPTWARQAAEKFEAITHPEDRRMLHALLFKGTQDFFGFGRRF